jgi:hypothetical protein
MPTLRKGGLSDAHVRPQLSPEMLQRIDDYLDMGVPWIWVIDPLTCQGQVYKTEGASRVKDMIFRTDRFTVNLAPARTVLSK